MSRVVLASGSPRRRALLAALGMEFRVVPSDAEEMFSGEPGWLVEENARRKCVEVCGRLEEPAVVIAADTLVFVDGDVLGKPKDLDEARAMLTRLSGRAHEVRTGLAVCGGPDGDVHTAHETTGVRFRDLSAAEIARFVEVVNPLDRAGAYTTEGPGSLLVAAYEGCYFNVLGLPMARLEALLGTLGLSLFSWVHAQRAQFL